MSNESSSDNPNEPTKHVQLAAPAVVVQAAVEKKISKSIEADKKATVNETKKAPTKRQKIPLAAGLCFEKKKNNNNEY